MIFELILLSLIILLAVSYYLLILFVKINWKKNIQTTFEKILEPSLSISIIVCARNEEHNIEACLKSLIALDYPRELYQIIIVDDHSEDQTAEIVRSYSGVQLLRLSDKLKGKRTGSYKKQGIKYGIENSTGDWIVTTDADCVVNPSWLRSILSLQKESDCDFIAGPVMIKNQNTIWGRFEALDFMGMMGLTGAGINSEKWFLANGANMAFSRSCFNQLEVYRENYASGDDVYLIRAFREANFKIKFNVDPNAVVKTRGNETFAGFIKQRIRWGTKNKNPGSISAGLMMSIPFLFALAILFLLGFSFFSLSAFVVLLFVVFLKWAIDYFYLIQLAEHFNLQKLLIGFSVSSVLHILYISLFGISALLVRKYKWKGRTVK